MANVRNEVCNLDGGVARGTVQAATLPVELRRHRTARHFTWDGNGNGSKGGRTTSLIRMTPHVSTSMGGAANTRTSYHRLLGSKW